MSKKSVICPRCKEFIGEIGNLEECPLCGYRILDSEEETE